MTEPKNDIVIPKGKKIYFAADFHLGAPSAEESLQREKKVVSWLSSIQESAAHIFILGDIFDFWFEYRYTIPKGFTRILGQFIHLRDQGIPITIFTGNHDRWMFGYFEEEFDIPIIKTPGTFILNNKKFLIGHGDGLGPGDKRYKIIKKIFENKLAQWIFHWIHPNWGIGLARLWSNRSRDRNLIKDKENNGNDERLLEFCKKTEDRDHHDFYIFGHRHLAMDIQINPASRYINTGDWIDSYTYAEFDGEDVSLKNYEN